MNLFTVFHSSYYNIPVRIAMNVQHACSLLHILRISSIQCGLYFLSANQESGEILNIILRVLTDGPEEPLPPLNWKSILTPLVKIYIGMCNDFKGEGYMRPLNYISELSGRLTAMMKAYDLLKPK